MAEAFARYFGEGRIEAYSAGSRPAKQVNPLAIEVMREVGIEMSQQKPKGFDSLPQEGFDIVVTMGCGDVCPVVPAESHIIWEIEDPKGKGIEFFRKTRDQIRANVKTLLAEVS